MSIKKLVLDSVLSAMPNLRSRLEEYFLFSRFAESVENYRKGGLPIQVVYDIGARSGHWAGQVDRRIPGCSFYLFEANESCEADLKKSGYPYFLGVLSSHERDVEFYSVGSTGDSYYKEDTQWYEGVVPQVKVARSLDTVVREKGIPLPDLIKIDTQGSELDILSGGAACLENASLVYLECPLVGYNSGAPSLDGYLTFLRAAGFLPVAVHEVHVIHGVAVQLDLLFLKISRLGSSGELALRWLG